MGKSYSELSKDIKPDALVRRAIKVLGRTGNALDVGAGSLRNTKLMLESGFEVTAIDKDPIILEAAKEIQNSDLFVEVLGMADYEFKKKYDLIISINVLPFLDKDTLLNSIPKMKDALVDDGVLAVTFFGVRDDWADKEDMSFFIREEVEELFSDMNVIMFSEEDYDGEIIQKIPKHWHIFRIIAKT
ncbi:MAG: methyltransferase domain-containing protein [Candidatus Pacebacteria bacterium]|nr:methyltransferase domain-containing protein [Candidatus Paceibacterota bacterium]